MRAVIVGLVLLVVAAPLVIASTVWAPAAVVWETFGVHYTALPTAVLNYHFIGNAMGFAVLYAYAPSAIAHFWLDPSRSETLQLYILMLYGIQALLTGALALWMRGRDLSFRAQIIVLLLVAVLPLWLATKYINFLTPNYFWLATLLYSIAAVLWVEAITGRLKVGVGLAALIGCAVSLAVCTKFTYAITLAPFLALPLVLTGVKRRILAAALAAFLATTLTIFTIYLAGHVEYAARFSADLQGMYTVDYLNQRYPPLWAELLSWPRLDSALQGAVLMAGAATLSGLVATVQRPSFTAWLFLVLSLTVSVLFVPFLETRAAGNSFVDAVIFFSFLAGVWAAVLSEQSRPASLSIVGLYCALVVWQVFGVFKIQEWIPRLQNTTASAFQIEQDIQTRQRLPVVYYWAAGDGRGPIWNGSPLWPSTYLYALVCGRQETKVQYLHKYFGGTLHRAILDGLLPQSHVAVFQENSTVTRDPVGTAQQSRVHDCRSHRVDLAWTDFDSTEGALITICSVSAATP
jgi:hypothetical protein